MKMSTAFRNVHSRSLAFGSDTWTRDSSVARRRVRTVESDTVRAA